MAKKSTTSAQEQGSGKKILVIAEKPSVAGDFVKALEPVEGKFRKDTKYWESEHYVVSYAIGHLVTLADPAEIDERYKGWKIDTLPIIPDHFVLKPIEESRPQLSALNKLCRRRDVELIVNACDAGREGELIFRYIMDYLGHDKKIARPTKRLWLQSMTPAAIRDAFAKLRPSEEMADLAAQQAQSPGGGEEKDYAQRPADDQQHGKGGAHNGFRLFLVALSPCDGGQGGPAGAAQVGERPDQRDQGKADAQPRQG